MENRAWIGQIICSWSKKRLLMLSNHIIQRKYSFMPWQKDREEHSQVQMTQLESEPSNFE